MKDEVIFLPEDKRQVFPQTDTIVLGACGQTCLITQNNKFAISLQCLKKEASDEVDFFPCRQA